MYILGIETSCDETAAAVVKDGCEILSNVVVSQIDIFKEYGGVIPEVAARSHLEAILPVINKALLDAFPGQTLPDDHARLTTAWNKIDCIAVTHTPGLLGSLLIGTLTARTLAILHNKPLYPVHHLKSHIYANWLNIAQGQKGFQSNGFGPLGKSDNINPSERRTEKLVRNEDGLDVVTFANSRRGVARSGNTYDELLPTFPLLALVVSGGHTQIIRMTKHNQFEIIGTTRDDAVGECFDKVAKILGLPYPGGPSISKAAKDGDPKRYHFPHPKLSSPNRGEARYSDLDFSFSGLKTAVLREVQKAVGKPISFPSHELKNLLSKQQVADFAASFENTATDILIENLERALEQYPDTKSICLAGGVSANKLLVEKSRKVFLQDISPASKKTYIPDVPDWFAQRAVPSADQRMTFSCETGASKNTLRLFSPNISLTGDNAAMVAAAAFYEIQSGVQPTDPYKVSLAPRSTIH